MKSTPLLKHLAGAVVGAVALLGAVPAMADTITFDSHGPDVFAGGDTFDEAGYTMQVLDTMAGSGGGFAGAIGDQSSCMVAACPAGNSSMFYLGMNDGGLSIHRTDAAAFSFHGLDYAFAAPVGGLPNFNYGKLVLTGTLTSGDTVSRAFDFPLQNAAGSYLFGALPLDAAFAQASLSALTINACLFDASGSCFNPAANQAQFAIDNVDVNVSAVPEPASYAMLMLGLGAVAFAARRRAGAAVPTLPAQA